MVDEGTIKFSSQRRDGAVPASAALEELNQCRTALFELGLIGVLPDGIGYGNLSVRNAGLQFVISASATGAHRVLRMDQYSLVEAFSIEANRVQSVGRLPASSESMTHGAIYAADPAVRCVIHVHSRVLFDGLLQPHGAATAADVPYGTPAMARAVAALVTAQAQLPALFAMAGHQDGVVAYGSNIASTYALVSDTLRRIST